MSSPDRCNLTARCKLCAHETQRLLYTKNGFQIVRCDACGLVSTCLPQGFDTLRIYDDSYFSGGQRDGYSDYRSSQAVLRSG